MKNAKFYIAVAGIAAILFANGCKKDTAPTPQSAHQNVKLATTDSTGVSGGQDHPTPPNN